MWQPAACRSHLAHYGSSALAVSLCAPDRVSQMPDVCRWLWFYHLARLQEAGALPASPFFLAGPLLATGLWEICIPPRPGRASQRSTWDLGVQAPLASGAGQRAAGHALSLQPLFSFGTTPSLRLLKIVSLAPKKTSTTPHKSSDLKHTECRVPWGQHKRHCGSA